MLPYFQYDTIAIGPITLQVWGIWVAVGILAAVGLALKLTKKYFLAEPIMLDLALWALMGGLVGARFGHVFFYNWPFYLVHPAEIYRFWHGGASSLGGFLGAAAGVCIFVWARELAWHDLLPYFDIGALCLWLGWGIGRIGCFFIHDHPGRLSNFFLAVNFPAGPRFDLGLFESLLAFLLFAVYCLLFTRLIRIRWGIVGLLSVASYAFVRFWLDFLRATDLPFSDPRYFHLTPAQWGMGAMLVGLTGMVIYSRIKKHKSVTKL